MNGAVIRLIALPLLWLLAVGAMAQESRTVRIGIQSRHDESGVLVSPSRGSYVLIGDAGDTLYVFRPDDVISVQAVGDSISLKGVYGLDHRVQSARLAGTGPRPSFLLKTSRRQADLIYPDHLHLSARASRLVLVNEAGLERYVSRVVQCEVGKGAEQAFYEVQSIIARTYAVLNADRHEKDGFGLCDHQHCQVFDGTVLPTDETVRAASATGGIILADTAGNPALAAYHANCGGQTASSGDVWAEPRHYLTSVKDTFCLQARSARWEERIPLADWCAYFGIPTDSSDAPWPLAEAVRAKFVEAGGKRFAMSDMRRDFRLRSAFFSAVREGDEAVLNGRGFGHGVGLCQQGAMRMAVQGMGHSDIIGHYYSGVVLKVLE